MFLADEVLVRVQRVGVGDHDGRAEFVNLGRAMGDRGDADALRRAVFDEDLVHGSALEDTAAARREPAAEVVGEFLRTAFRIVIAQKIGQSQHRVEQVGSSIRQRSPVRCVRHQQRLQTWIAKMQVQLVGHAELLQLPRFVVIDAFEIVQQPIQIGLPQLGKVGFDTALLFGKEALQLGEEFTEVGRN